MGKTPNIQTEAQKLADFNNYLQNLQSDLNNKAQNVDKALSDMITKFYQDNKYDDSVDIVSTKNTDFMQLTEFKLDNLLNVAQQIATVIFGGVGTTPPGTKINEQGIDAAKQGISDFAGEGAKAVNSMTNYTAGKATDAITSVILSANTTSSIAYSSELKSVPLGYGLQLFVAVCSCSYQNSAFLNNDIIYEYLYFADVKFSKKQAQTEAGIMLAKLYQDEIAAYVKQEESLLDKLSTGTLDVTAYQSSKAMYDGFIANANESIKKLSN